MTPEEAKELEFLRWIYSWQKNWGWDILAVAEEDFTAKTQQEIPEVKPPEKYPFEY